MKRTLFATIAMLLIAISGCSNTKDSEGDSGSKKAGDTASSSNSKSADSSAATADAFAVAPVVTPAKAPAVGDAVPEITGPDTDGQVFNLSDYRGKVVMIDFWGDW